MLGAVVGWPPQWLVGLPSPTDDGQEPGGSPGSPGEKLQEWSSLIGIVTAIVGNLLIALALNVQRYAHIRLHKERHRIRRRARGALLRAEDGNQRGSYGAISDNGGTNGYGNGHGGSSAILSDDERALDSRESDPLTGSCHSDTPSKADGEQEDAEPSSSYLKSPYWWLGQVLITLGEMGNFLAYGFAPASIVSPLGVVALISNCIIAPVMFHEAFRQRDFWGVVIAVGGVVTVVLSAKQEETKLNPHDVWDAITALPFEIYLGVTVGLIIVLMWASPRYGKRTILIDLGLVGLFGGYTALATKGVSSMLSSTLWRAFTTPVTYALILILLVTAVMQIRYVNKALQRFDSTQVIPIQFVMFTLCVILGSAVLYRDFERTTKERAAKFVGGCLLTFFGVFLITSGRESSHGEEDDDILSDAEGVEETIGLARQNGNSSAPGEGGQDCPPPPSRSRRSSRQSHISFADTVKTITPRHEGSVPPVRILATNSMPHSSTQDSLVTGNPWQDMGGPSTPPDRDIRSASSDAVPTEQHAMLLPSHPMTPVRSVTAPEGATPQRPSLSPVKPGTNSRSRTFISPSPLSSTVTAVVKDAFLRANDDPRLQKSSLRRIRSSIRAGLFFNDDGETAPLAAEDSLAMAFGEAEGPAGDGDQGRRRSRSVSDTLGDFFRVRKKKPKGGNAASDAEEGNNTTPDSDNLYEQQTSSTPLLNP